jgi:hypothetical protein
MAERSRTTADAIDEELFQELAEENKADETVTGEEGEQQTEKQVDEDAQVYTFADAAPAPDDEDIPEGQESTVIKTLREKQREDAREKAELAKQLRERDEQLAALSGANQKPPALGAKPMRSDPDIDFDDEKFSVALEEWTKRKVALEAEQSAKADAEREAQEAFRQKQERYTRAKEKIAVADYDVAEATVMNALSKDKKFAILLDLADAPQHLVYALGKSPDKLDELAKLSVPMFIKKLGSLETQMKPQSTQRKPPPPAERQTYGGKTVAATTQSKRLEALKAAADKSGDYTAYHAAKREQKAA